MKEPLGVADEHASRPVHRVRTAKSKENLTASNVPPRQVILHPPHRHRMTKIGMRKPILASVTIISVVSIRKRTPVCEGDEVVERT